MARRPFLQPWISLRGGKGMKTKLKVHRREVVSPSLLRGRRTGFPKRHRLIAGKIPVQSRLLEQRFNLGTDFQHVLKVNRQPRQLEHTARVSLTEFASPCYEAMLGEPVQAALRAEARFRAAVEDFFPAVAFLFVQAIRIFEAKLRVQ